VAAATGTYLDRILENTRAELASRRAAMPYAELERAASAAPTPVSVEGLRAEHVTVIAEFKRASPSKGAIAPNAVARAIAREYVAGGAGAISVLTDARYFGGSLGDLRAVADVAHAGARPTPVLRKDFVIDAYQLAEARAVGADIVLLIVAALGDAELRELLAAARDFGLAALVEVHDEGELERALAVDAMLVGINNRDLRSFQVDLATTERLASLAPPGVTLVGESGIQTRADVRRLGRAGVRAVLVGESLMRAPDRAAAMRELLS
jgi:indole-3-glycerol phosphate synthase